jgi:hypothetical protein
MIKEHYTFKDFLPLIIILTSILVISIIIPILTDGNVMLGMRIFMGGFFIVFGTLKIIKLKDFASAYQMYDIIAMKSKTYAYMYPFLEMLLGISFLLNTVPLVTNWVTLIIMIISAIGVYLKLRKKETIMCACLGTVFKVPMTWVTLAEDVLMAGMAIIMIFMLS